MAKLARLAKLGQDLLAWPDLAKILARSVASPKNWPNRDQILLVPESPGREAGSVLAVLAFHEHKKALVFGSDNFSAFL